MKVKEPSTWLALYKERNPSFLLLVSLTLYNPGQSYPFWASDSKKRFGLSGSQPWLHINTTWRSGKIKIKQWCRGWCVPTHTGIQIPLVRSGSLQSVFYLSLFFSPNQYLLKAPQVQPRWRRAHQKCLLRPSPPLWCKYYPGEVPKDRTRHLLR